MIIIFKVLAHRLGLIFLRMGNRAILTQMCVVAVSCKNRLSLSLIWGFFFSFYLLFY